MKFFTPPQGCLRARWHERNLSSSVVTPGFFRRSSSGQDPLSLNVSQHQGLSTVRHTLGKTTYRAPSTQPHRITKCYFILLIANAYIALTMYQALFHVLHTILTHSVLTATLGGKDYPHFTDRETEARRG